LHTLYPKEVTSNSALLGGYIINSSEDIHPVTEKGICYDTSPDPTTKSIVVILGSGDEEFSATVENLEVGTKYYVRAYAINEFGTSYGEEYIFCTND